MTTTREKALEAALRAALPFAERIAATTPTTPTRSQRQHEAAKAANEARAALAMPADTVNADMLAALHDVRAVLAVAQSSGDDGVAPHIARIDAVLNRATG